METKNSEAMANVSIAVLSLPQPELLKALWCHKKRFDKLCETGGTKILSLENFEALLKEFKSHWSRIDYVAINLGHKAVSPKYAKNEKLRRQSKARLLEAARLLKELGFEFVAEYHSRTETSGVNSIVLLEPSKGEICFVLNEGVDGEEKSPVTACVERWGEGIQHIAVDVKRTASARENIKYFIMRLSDAGFAFLAGANVFKGETQSGDKIRQCFTEEIEKEFFFSLIERTGGRGELSPEILQKLHEFLEHHHN